MRLVAVAAILLCSPFAAAEAQVATTFDEVIPSGRNFDKAEFSLWQPKNLDRVRAVVVNKGGIYYSALLPQAARSVPGMLFVGAGLFAVNRRAGALWALAEEPNAAHVVGRSRDLSLIFFEEVLPLRLPGSEAALQPITEASGFPGDLKAKTFQKQSGPAPNYPTAWLPTARVARAWEALVTEKPFEP